MREILPDLERWREAGERIAIATVTGVRKSAPRPPGAKMAVSESGQVAGTVSGGCVEGAVVEAAKAVLAGGEPHLMHFGIADDEAWEIGLPCGGEIDVWVELYSTTGLESAARNSGRAVEVTVTEGDGVGRKLCFTPDSAFTGDLGDSTLEAQAVFDAEELMWAERSQQRGRLFIDVIAPPPRLILVGAVDVSAALCRLARAAGWHPWIVDPRATFATPERFPEAEGIVVAWPAQAFAQLGGLDQATSVAVLTHDPKIDDAALEVALRSPARFVGAMGSRRATESRRERLLEAGITESQLDRLAAPLGLDLGATSVGETALSMFAEIVADRNGRDGGRLRSTDGRIHDVPA
ncbi:MAG: XdhC family protein [Actinomycetes bacterium]